MEKVKMSLVRSDEPLQLGEATVVFLDLDEFHGACLEDKVDHAIQKILHSGYSVDRQALMPCIVVLGPDTLEPAQTAKLAQAGAIFCPSPQGYNTTSSEVEKKESLQAWLQGVYPELEDFDGESMLQEPEEPPDLTIYIKPPYEISDDDYARLLNRLQLTDDDPQKDD